MKQISVREFQLHQALYLKQLPIVLTQYKKPIALVSDFTEISVNTIEMNDKISAKSVNTNKQQKLKALEKTIESVNTIPSKLNICQMPKAFCRTEGYLYKLVTYQEEGEVSKEMLLCDKHVSEIQKQGVEVIII